MELHGIDSLRIDDKARIQALADMGGESFMEELMTLELFSVLPIGHDAKTAISQKIIFCNLMAAIPYGGTYCTDDDSALAIAYLKSELGQTRWSEIEDAADDAAIGSISDPEIRSALRNQLDKMGPIANFGWQDDFVSSTDRNPDGDFLAFSFLAVDKNKRGTGAFRRLVSPYLEYADERGIPCFLETYSDNLEQLYGHFGFKTVKELRSPDFTIYERCMMRLPQA